MNFPLSYVTVKNNAWCWSKQKNIAALRGALSWEQIPVLQPTLLLVWLCEDHTSCEVTMGTAITVYLDNLCFQSIYFPLSLQQRIDIKLGIFFFFKAMCAKPYHMVQKSINTSLYHTNWKGIIFCPSKNLLSHFNTPLRANC